MQRWCRSPGWPAQQLVQQHLLLLPLALLRRLPAAFGAVPAACEAPLAAPQVSCHQPLHLLLQLRRCARLWLHLQSQHGIAAHLRGRQAGGQRVVLAGQRALLPPVQPRAAGEACLVQLALQQR
jgi:hypothetical protein